MGRIDSISKSFESEYGVDLSTGKFIKVDNYHGMENKVDVIEEIIDVSKVVPSQSGQSDIEERSAEYIIDEENVKRNIRELISKGMDLADDMFEIVRVSESAKSFEPASAYLKTLVELNEKLLDIHDRRNKGKQQSKEKGGSTITTNNVQQNNVAVTMDPATLLKLMKENSK